MKMCVFFPPGRTRSPERAMQRSSWLQPTAALVDDRDFYSWARDNGVYIPHEELLAIFEQRKIETPPIGAPSVLVIDVRDDDANGGHISGALHFPDSTFVHRIAEVLAVLRARQPTLVVLHCMESVRRGPRCAYRLRARLEAEARPSHLPPVAAVRVLQGGADLWLRRHWRHAHLVEDYDDDFWGFESNDVFDEENSDQTR